MKTFRIAVVDPVDGVMAIQVEFELAVKAIGPVALSTRMLCGAGSAPPTVCENVNDAGAVVIIGAPPAATVSVTGTVRVPEAVVITTVP